MAQGRFVAYYRVSTQRQGQSGLGLEAQRTAVEGYLNGGGWELVREFTEVESGKREDRPELGRALAACRVYGATLIIAKLDRLSRDAHFLLGLQKAGVPFVAADMPHADSATVGIMAVVAQKEREMIGQRTKAALASAKAQGARLGNPANLGTAARTKGTARSAAVRHESAAARARAILPELKEIRAAGATSLREVAAELNRRGVPAPRGGKWHAATVQRVIATAG